MNEILILPTSGPFFRNVHHGRIQHLEKAAIYRGNRFGLRDLPQLAVETLNGICGVNQSTNLLRILEAGAKIWAFFSEDRTSVRKVLENMLLHQSL